MNVFDMAGKSEGLDGLKARELYDQLRDDSYSQYPYEKESLGEGMWIVNEVISGYWKPRYLIDKTHKSAVEFMNSQTILQTVTADDIDWQSLDRLPKKVVDRARALNAWFPTFIRRYNSGLAAVEWELNPDGRYYMDDDGFGMTDDDEVSIYGYVDRNGKPLMKFRAIKDYSELDGMKKEARRILESRRCNL